MARRYCNGAVRPEHAEFSEQPRRRLFGFGERDYFELADASEGAVPQVALAPRT
jgi:hypothetical protein